MGVERFNPPGARYDGMSQALRCGDFIMLSGQISMVNGEIVGIDNAVHQARQCFRNIELALAEAGANLSQVVNVRCSLVNADDYPAYAAVKFELFEHNPPCSSVSVVAGLLRPELLMEIEAMAWAPR